MRELEQQLEQANKEQEALIDIFSDERIRRDSEEENLRVKLKVVPFSFLWAMGSNITVVKIRVIVLQEASKTIQDLLKKVKIWHQ